jgi:GDP-mannose 4,6 dehydratase
MLGLDQLSQFHATTGVLFNHESPIRPQRFVTRKVIATACRMARGNDEKLTLGNIQIRRDWGWAPGQRRKSGTHTGLEGKGAHERGHCNDGARGDGG